MGAPRTWHWQRRESAMRLLCEVVAAVLCLLSPGAGTGAAQHCTREWAVTPDATVGLRSVNGDGQQERKLRMVNTCADEVVIYWMDLNGEEVELKRLKPGRKTSMMTATGHAFRVYFAAGFTSVRADLPESALPLSTSRQLALEHTVHLESSEHSEASDPSDPSDQNWIRIAPCGADATPFHHQRIKSTDPQTTAELPSTDSGTRPAPVSTDNIDSARPTPAHEESQRRLRELEEQLQRREAEAAARQAEQEVREEQLRVTLEQSQAAVRQQEEQARLATEAAAAAVAQAAASSAAVLDAATISQQHRKVNEDAVEEDLVVTAAVALACMLAATAAWLYNQLRKSASANIELLHKVQQEPHAQSMTALSEEVGAEGGATGREASPSTSSGEKRASRADDSVAMPAPQWTTAAMRRAAAAVNKEQFPEGDSSSSTNSTDGSKKRGGSAEAALRATEEQLRAALVAGRSASTAPQSQSHTLDEASPPSTPKKLRTARPASSPISPQSSLSELEDKLQELGARDGRLGKLLLEASAQGILNSPISSSSSAATVSATEPEVAGAESGHRGEERKLVGSSSNEPTEYDSIVGAGSVPLGSTQQIGGIDSTSASPSDRLLARVVSRGRPGEDI